MSNNLVEGNYEQIILSLLARVKHLEEAEVHGSEAADSFDSLGDMRAGRFLALSSGQEPDDSDACGVVMDADGHVFGDDSYNHYGVNLGIFQFGFSATTGKGVLCNGNITLDVDGITGTDLLKWMIKQTATNASNERTGKLSMALADGGSIPQLELSLESPTGDAVTIVNGDFATGDFTGWTKTTETNGAWAAALFYGEFSAFNITGSPFNCVGILTGDRITDITAGLNYLFGFRVKCYKTPIPVSPAAWATVKIELKWYDHASAGNLLRTDIVYTGQPVSWTTQSLAVIAPTGALSYTIVATLPSTALANNYGGYFSIDDFTMSEITVNQKIWLEDAGVGLKNSIGEDGLLDWGTYTPTLTNGTNVADSTAFLCHWFRVGNTVTVSGAVNINTTSTGASVISMTIPVASVFTNSYQGGGAGTTQTKDCGRFVTNSVTHGMTMNWTAIETANNSWSFIFSYQIV